MSVDAKPPSGGANSYWIIPIDNPTSLPDRYRVECNDIIEALNMTFAEGECFKALWRLAAARQGRGKPGMTQRYDAEKVNFYGRRVLVNTPENK